MTTSEDIEKAIEILQSQLEKMDDREFSYKVQLRGLMDRKQKLRDSIQGLRRMEIERERK